MKFLPAVAFLLIASTSAYAQGPSASCPRCPQEIKVSGNPDYPPLIPQALPAPLQTRTVLDRPANPIEVGQYDPASNLSPALQDELKRHGLVAVNRMHLQRLLEAVDENLALNKGR